MYTRERCAPHTPPSGKVLTHAQVFAHAYINVKFQLCIAPLTCDLQRTLFIIGFASKGPPKWFFGGIFGKNPLGMQRPPIYAFSGIFGPDLTRRAVAFCMDIAICYRQKFGQVWGSSAPLSDVAGNFRYRKASL